MTPVIPNNRDGITIDIAANNMWHYPKMTALGMIPSPESAMPTFAGGSRILDHNGKGLLFTLGRHDSFRFKINFLLAPSQAVYDAPAMDDITFMFESAKPTVLRYQVVN